MTPRNGSAMAEEPLMSIGAVAKATGIPVETLRTWERRYGFPEPIRMPSGHRRYPSAAVEKLRLIAEAKAIGLRPAETSKLAVDELRALVGYQPAADTDAPETDWELADWLRHIRAMNGPEFDAQLMREWARLGAEPLFDTVLGPLLVAVGDAWETGALSVAQEHWASERIRDSLAGHWRPMAASNQGPLFVCAALPGEQHDLGLHMLAVIVAMNGCRLVFLGANTPLEGIVSTAETHRASGVLVSVSAACAKPESAALLERLSSLLPEGLRLVVGGKGAPDTPGATRLTSWKDLVEIVSHVRNSTR